MKPFYQFTILSVLAFITQNTSAQISKTDNTATGNPEYVGWNASGTSKDLDIKNQFGIKNINFFTNNGTSTTQKMTILGNNGATDGFVGIGTTTPTSNLDVNGLINVPFQATGGYLISGTVALATNAASNIFVGHESGYSITTGSNITAVGYRALHLNEGGIKNVAVGGLALYTNVSGQKNTAVGYDALHYNIDNYNVAVGCSTLFSNNTGYGNAALGYLALYTNDDGIENTGVGENALFTNTGGDYNTACGADAGSANVSGNNNSFFGYRAGYFNTASDNVFAGYKSGYTNTSGTKNTFLGLEAGTLNTTAGENVAVGYQSLYTQSHSNGGTAWSSANVAVGYQALYSNAPGSTITGVGNTAVGWKALYSNTTAPSNTAVGYEAGYSQTTNGQNIFIGHKAGRATTTGYENAVAGSYAGYLNTTGYDNAFFGYGAGWNNTTGNSNTCIGFGSDVGASGSVGRGAFGYNAVNNQGDNTIWLGNSTCKAVWVATGGSYNVSDGRFKFNIKEEVKGLDFIKKLRPVTYQVNTEQLDDFVIQTLADSAKTRHKQGMNFTDTKSIVHAGFIAQEVEQAEKDCGFTSSIVSVPADPAKSNYGLNYSALVVPLVKAVQEQQSMIESLQAEIATLKGGNHRGNGSQGSLTQPSDKTGTTLEVELANNNQVILYQNEPNPFDGSTVIRYFIPDNVTSAYVGFYDMYGKEIKKLEIKEKGFGKIEANTENLAAGIYSYSIVTDGKTAATKMMIRNK